MVITLLFYYCNINNLVNNHRDYCLYKIEIMNYQIHINKAKLKIHKTIKIKQYYNILLFYHYLYCQILI